MQNIRPFCWSCRWPLFSYIFHPGQHRMAGSWSAFEETSPLWNTVFQTRDLGEESIGRRMGTPRKSPSVRETQEIS
jgi:hypothetical protein